MITASRLKPTGIVERMDRRTKVQCLCSCGNVGFYDKYKVTKGHTRSCGCLRKEIARKTAQTRVCKPMSEKRKKEISIFFKARIGEKNPAWRGGRTELQKALRTSSKYREWRSKVFARDNYTCTECSTRGGYIEAHHKKPFITIIRENGIGSLEEANKCSELWDTSNGVTLCKDCHDKTKSTHLRKRQLKPIYRVRRKCKQCGKVEHVYPSLARRPFCGRNCYIKNKRRNQ